MEEKIQRFRLNEIAKIEKIFDLDKRRKLRRLLKEKVQRMWTDYHYRDYHYSDYPSVTPCTTPYKIYDDNGCVHQYRIKQEEKPLGFIKDNRKRLNYLKSLILSRMKMGKTVNHLIWKVRKIYSSFAQIYASFSAKYASFSSRYVSFSVIKSPTVENYLKNEFPRWCLDLRLENPWVKPGDMSSSAEKCLLVGYDIPDKKNLNKHRRNAHKNAVLPKKGDFVRPFQIGKSTFVSLMIPKKDDFVSGNQTFMSFTKLENGFYTLQIKINLKGILPHVRNQWRLYYRSIASYLEKKVGTKLIHLK